MTTKPENELMVCQYLLEFSWVELTWIDTGQKLLSWKEEYYYYILCQFESTQLVKIPTRIDSPIIVLFSKWIWKVYMNWSMKSLKKCVAFFCTGDITLQKSKYTWVSKWMTSEHKLRGISWRLILLEVGIKFFFMRDAKS